VYKFNDKERFFRVDQGLTNFMHMVECGTDFYKTPKMCVGHFLCCKVVMPLCPKTAALSRYSIVKLKAHVGNIAC
jgi:hypothetical protein